MHELTELYQSGYDAPALASWARRVRRWAAATGGRGNRDVFLFFDNDAKTHAPGDARALAQRFGLASSANGDAALSTEITW